MKPRPEVLTGRTTKIKTGLGNLFITINESEGKPFEVFATIGKSGGSIMAKAEVTGRLVSLALRNDIPIEEIIKQLLDISGSEPIAYKNTVVHSIPDAIGKVLQELYVPKPNIKNPPTLTE